MQPVRHIWAIAGQTLTEARRNKVFYSIFLFGLIVVLNSYLFTEVTMATMERVLKDTALGAINVFALALTIFTGVGVINREIDKKSVYSILAKPIARYEFIVGKYFGLLAIIIGTSVFMLLAMIAAMLLYRMPITASPVIAYFGILLEAAVLGALAVLCSSFTSSFVSAFICGAVFVSGHLSGELRFFAGRSASPIVRLGGTWIYYLVPNLERFNFKFQATYDTAVAGSTLLVTTGYAAAYVVAFLTASVVVFSARDLR